MACAGLKTENVVSNDSSTKRIVDLALAMMHYIRTVVWSS